MKLTVAALTMAFASLAVSSAPAMSADMRRVPLVQIDYACGRGWHVTPWGHCRPNNQWRPEQQRWGWSRYQPAPPWEREHRRYRDDWRGAPPPRW